MANGFRFRITNSPSDPQASSAFLIRFRENLLQERGIGQDLWRIFGELLPDGDLHRACLSQFDGFLEDLVDVDRFFLDP